MADNTSSGTTTHDHNVSPDQHNHHHRERHHQKPHVGQNHNNNHPTAAASNSTGGHPSNGLPTYKKTVAIIGSKYCSPNPVDLIVTRKVLHISSGNFIVEDVNGNIMFKVKDGIQLLRDRRVLLDADDKPLVTMQQKFMTAHNRWNVFRGDSKDPKDLLFCAKESSMFQLRTKLDVFLASNEHEDICDFMVKGSWSERTCTIYDGDSNIIITQMHKKTTFGSVMLGKDKFMVTVYPNIDCAFIVALIVILDAVNYDIDL